MPGIEVLDSGHVDRSDSAFPTVVMLDDGDLVCAYSVGGGAHVSGGTHCSRSSDGGRTWSCQGTVLEPTKNPLTTNHLRLSRTANGTILAYGQRDQKDQSGKRSRYLPCDPVLCRSSDGGRTWSAPQVIPFRIPGPYEISNSIVVASDGAWLARRPLPSTRAATASEWSCTSPATRGPPGRRCTPCSRTPRERSGTSNRR